MAELNITVSDETLPSDIVLRINHGNGFEDNAARLGWQPELQLEQSVLDAGLQNVLDQVAGSAARLEAQAALQKLQQQTRPNPETALLFLVVHIRKQIDQVLADPDEMSRKQQELMVQIEAEAEASLDARRVIEFVAKSA